MSNPSIPTSVIDLFEKCIENTKKHNIQGALVVSFQGDGRVNISTFGITFQAALMSQYMVKNLVEEKFVELQSEGKKGN